MFSNFHTFKNWMQISGTSMVWYGMGWDEFPVISNLHFAQSLFITPKDQKWCNYDRSLSHSSFAITNWLSSCISKIVRQSKCIGPIWTWIWMTVTKNWCESCHHHFEPFEPNPLIYTNMVWSLPAITAVQKIPIKNGCHALFDLPPWVCRSKQSYIYIAHEVSKPIRKKRTNEMVCQTMQSRHFPGTKG